MASFYNFNVTEYKWHKEDELYVIDNDFYISLDDKRHCYTFKIHKGFKTDGGSIPKALEWLVGPGWNDKDNKYNATFILHDGCYASEIVSKELADDMLRSSLRDCNISRKKAGAIHRAVMMFAKCHYGKKYDSFNVQTLITLDSIVHRRLK